MSSQWTSKYAIMRDLSLAQGFDVPAALDSTVGMGEKPPALGITEDTEEEYFGHCVGDGDTPTAPDLGLIQQMLEMVRGSDVSDEDEVGFLQITKPPCENGIKKLNNGTLPKIVNTNNAIQSSPMKKTKKKRENVALNSLLESIAGNTPIKNMENPTEPLKLLKPTDFISTDKEIVESVEKVNGWLDSQQHKDIKPKHRHLNWEPSSMFKRKSASTVKSTESDSNKSSPPQKFTPTATATYQPSTMADEYYKKYVERSKLREIVNEDVWTRAERMMKDIDAKKQAETDAIAEMAAIEVTDTAASNSPESLVGADTTPEAIQLPQHRHLLTGDCVVCSVVKGRGFDVDADLSK